MDKILEFYNSYDEDTRLSVRHTTEFIVTTYHLDTIIKPRFNILDTSAGTGIYSLYYASKGCRVEAMDIVPNHIELLNTRIDHNKLNLNAMVGDARNLMDFHNEEFDCVLNMGAIYHIEETDITPCLQENARVLKAGGYLVVSYVNKYQGYENDKFETYFNFHSPDEIEQYLTDLNMCILDHVPTDGDIYSNFENSNSDNLPNLQNYFKEEQQQLENLQQCHFWLEENMTEIEIRTIKEKFVHALLIARKL